MTVKKRAFLGMWLLVVVMLSGCQNTSYYSQAISGQFRILNERRPIQALLADEMTSAKLKKQLRLVMDIRRFAEKELMLPVEGNYSSYVDLQRPYVVWNVFAAPELSLTPKTWCYPIVGCLSYRGYFDRQDALKYSEILKNQGFDVYVAGISAYSTLGWFDDPVLSTFVNYPESNLAGIIFHEMAHQLIYIAGDTEFNESFAVAVEMEGLRRWFDHRDNSLEFERYLKGRQRRKEFVHLVLSYRDRIESVYQGTYTLADKRKMKSEH